MGDKTSIEWTAGDDGKPGATWNPVRGCSIISPGCKNCYALQMAARFSDPGYWGHGFAERTPRGPRWTGRLALLGQDTLNLPTRWREPRRVFVNSTSDLFHEGLTFEQIAAVYGVMAQTPRHTYIVLTKRARRLREFHEWVAQQGEEHGPPPDFVVTTMAVNFGAEIDQLVRLWPLPNVWTLVSVESQEYADERIPELLRVPSVVRGVSYEPALGPVDFRRIGRAGRGPDVDALTGHVTRYGYKPRTPDECGIDVAVSRELPALDWVIVGGESGPHARPFDVRWARDTVTACKAAGVACFVKQMGLRPVFTDDDRDLNVVEGYAVRLDAAGEEQHIPTQAEMEAGVVIPLRDKKGGDWSEWPEDLRVREFPEVRHGQ